MEFFIHYCIIDGVVTSMVGETDIIFDDVKLSRILGVPATSYCEYVKSVYQSREEGITPLSIAIKFSKR